MSTETQSPEHDRYEVFTEVCRAAGCRRLQDGRGGARAVREGDRQDSRCEAPDARTACVRVLVLKPIAWSSSEPRPRASAFPCGRSLAARIPGSYDQGCPGGELPAPRGVWLPAPPGRRARQHRGV